jgi:hypothetical protein
MPNQPITAAASGYTQAQKKLSIVLDTNREDFTDRT